MDESEEKIWNKDEFSEVDEEVEDSVKNDPLCPCVRIPKEERISLYKPWKKDLIIKLLGKRVGYRMLMNRLQKLWNPVGVFKLIYLQNEFFLVRFSIRDYMDVLHNGPWVVIGHYLMVQCWKPKLRPFEEKKNEKKAVWVQVPNLPIEYYNNHNL